MDYTEKPEYGRVIDICTSSALRELATPALLAVLTPVVIGFGINYLALGAFLAAVILTGQLMAVFLSNSGGAWDNAKKYIEDGHFGGKGSEAHKAAVIGDTVGDPFKDTAGPALNPLIKVMNLVSLLILPAVISLRNNDTARFGIAGAALVVLIIAVAFSKRQVASMADDEGAVEALVPEDGIGPDDPAEKIALEALDRWIYDLGDEEHELRQQLRNAKTELEAELKASLASGDAGRAKFKASAKGAAAKKQATTARTAQTRAKRR
jgi:K(+)-stimulated pyrophosphate-energized sodium pump